MKTNLLLTNLNATIKLQNLFLLVLLLTYAAIAQDSPYTRQGSIGVDKTEKSNRIFSVGDRIIFPPDKRNPEYYSSIKIEGETSDTQQAGQTGDGRYRVFDNFDTISTGGLSNPKDLNYKKYVGRVGKVIGLSEKNQSKQMLSIYTPLQIQMEDNNEKIKIVVVGNYSLVPVAPIDKARTAYKGKTIWFRDTLLSTYNQDGDSFGTLNLPKLYTPLTVIDVVVGWDRISPVRFVLKTKSGEEGYLDFSTDNFEEKFSDTFFTKDPRTIYKWSARAWAYIEDGQVWVGMNKAQAQLAWGEPDSVNRTTTRRGVMEQWVYGSSSYLYFVGGVLTSYQN